MSRRFRDLRPTEPIPIRARAGKPNHAAYIGDECIAPGEEVSAAEGPVVVTVRLTLVPGIADVDAREQFTPWVVGAEQLSVTGPLKPPSPAIARLKAATPPTETVLLSGVGVTVKSGGRKDAPTVWLLVIVSVQDGDVPEQAPVQPPKPAPLAGAAVRVTELPETKVDEHWLGQLMPCGALVTLPVPAPKQ